MLPEDFVRRNSRRLGKGAWGAGQTIQGRNLVIGLVRPLLVVVLGPKASDTLVASDTLATPVVFRSKNLLPSLPTFRDDNMYYLGVYEVLP